jgi:hypothetical protein
LLAFEATYVTSDTHWAKAPSSGELQNPGDFATGSLDKEFVRKNGFCDRVTFFKIIALNTMLSHV